ncbi:unnamed protein product [Clonostachys chloroleuca]|uniref:Uncharacterized protein n=1 Tax=Clonostachys chloroleuca TaxID=1926264 RepID=A0AA35QDL9_9HYPO|nr:unnamed protein product [Clonostachys chloroleuca]
MAHSTTFSSNSSNHHPRKGVADEELAKREAERARKREAEEHLPQRTLCPLFQLLLPPILEGSRNMTEIAVQRHHPEVVVWKIGAAVHLKARGPLAEIASPPRVRTQSDLTETETRELPATQNLIKGLSAGGTLKIQSLLMARIDTLSQGIFQEIVETRAKGTSEAIKTRGLGPEEDLTTEVGGATSTV